MNAGAGSAIKYQLDAVRVERPAALIAAAGANPFRNRPARRKAQIGRPVPERRQLRLDSRDHDPFDVLARADE